jgi:hypothetical protein
MAKRKNFVVIEHKAKQKGKSELVKFEEKVNDCLIKGYYLVNATTSYNPYSADGEEPFPVFHGFLVARQLRL